jgi:hypothetical protein
MKNGTMMNKQQAEQINALCHHPAWNTLMDVMKEKLDIVHEELESHAPDKLQRLQGKAEQIKEIIRLKKNIQESLQNN